MPKPPSKVKAFQSDWTLRYGIEVSTCNPLTSEVTSVLCLFCHQFGQEDEDASESENIPPISNTSSTHGEATINMRSFIQLEGSMKARIISKQKFKFIIDADIIETLIFGLLNSEEHGDEE